MGVLDWAPTPARNAGADPDIRASDGTSARDLPSAVRGVMAATVALALDQGGALISTGTNNVYVVETHSGIRPQAGASVTFWADRDNTAEPSLDIDGYGPRRWRGADGLSLPAGAIQGGLLYTVAWNAVPGAPSEWRIVGPNVGVTGAGIAPDYRGTLAERSQYDALPQGKTYLAVADTPNGPTWTLYLKRSDGYADWSSGLPIKESPAQSTVDAQAAADRAAAQIPLVVAAGAQQVEQARAQVDAATGQAVASAAAQGAADQARIASESARDAAALQAAAAETRAAEAAIAALNAQSHAALLESAVFDFNFDSSPDTSNDWNV